MSIPYAYGTENRTVRVWYIPYAYGTKYAYGIEQLHNVGFFVVSSCFLARFLSNHKRFEDQWLTYSPTDFHLLPIRGLPCRRDNILALFFAAGLFLAQILITTYVLNLTGYHSFHPIS